MIKTNVDEIAKRNTQRRAADVSNPIRALLSSLFPEV
jgi:hypothetical protein